MKRILLIITMLAAAFPVAAEEIRPIPAAWKWLGDGSVAYTYNGTYADSSAFAVNPRTGERRKVSAPARYTQFPLRPEGAVNLTFSPDSSMLAFTRGGDLFVADIASGQERRLTFDGSDLILNGYASWVYYEEIFGRPSRYRAFWWSPDSRSLAFYRFDNTLVPMFPIYSPFGQDGRLSRTRYPKCGEPNPKVRIGIIDLEGPGEPVWADFDENEDQYFGTPFWGADSKEFFVSREPRTQNTLDLFSVNPSDGSKKHIYHETYSTWLDWIDGMLFSEKGLYMVRNFETGWQQIYFLPYDGSPARRLSDGPNWRISLIRADSKGNVWFTANRSSTVRTGLYRLSPKGEISELTDPSLSVAGVSFSPDGKYFAASVSNFTTPTRLILCDASKAADPKLRAKATIVVEDAAGEDFDATAHALPRNITMTTPDGLVLPAYIVYPLDFDPTKKYPVHVDIYGGPDTPLVRDRWMGADYFKWWSDNGIIEVTADCRAAGHNGRTALDSIYRRLDEVETGDFVLWAEYLQSLPYVKADKIGVEGFSFGGTMTALLVMDHPEAYHYGIAGGGVYDWALYDTHYTERFMDTPQNNPEGYEKTRVINHAKNYPVEYSGGLDKSSLEDSPESVMLKITHGTGDDNVHFQNTLQLVDELQRHGKKFELMIYPDGMHGYRGYQGQHFNRANREFWLKYLLEEK